MKDAMKASSKLHQWLRVGALAGMLALSPLIFSNGSAGEDLVQINEAICAMCCYEEGSFCGTVWDFYSPSVSCFGPD